MPSPVSGTWDKLAAVKELDAGEDTPAELGVFPESSDK